MPTLSSEEMTKRGMDLLRAQAEVMHFAIDLVDKIAACEAIEPLPCLPENYVHLGGTRDLHRCWIDLYRSVMAFMMHPNDTLLWRQVDLALGAVSDIEGNELEGYVGKINMDHNT